MQQFYGSRIPGAVVMRQQHLRYSGSLASGSRHSAVWVLRHRNPLVLVASFLLRHSVGLAGTFKKSFFRAFAMQY